MKKEVPKCCECKEAHFMKGNGTPNRYYCYHPGCRDSVSPAKMICRTKRHSTEFTIKTSPKWCPKRAEV